MIFDFLSDKIMTNTVDFDADALPDLLAMYYKRLFPYDHYHKWLSYNNGKFFLL